MNTLTETLPEQIINSPDYIRIDKNIVKRGIDIVDTYGEESSLIIDILVYIADSYQNNFFGFGFLDPKDFASKLNHHTSNLKRTNKNSKDYQKLLEQGKDYSKLPDEEKNSYFVSYLEYALWKMGKINLEFRDGYQVKNHAKSEQVSSISFYQLLKNVNKHTDNKRKDMFYYSFEVCEIFTEHLSKYFTTIDKKSMAILRKNNCVPLYLYLVTLQDGIKANPKDKLTCIPKFNDIVDRANIGVAEPAEKKRALKNKLALIQQYSSLNFQFEWFKKRGTNHEYGIKLTFPDNKLLLTHADQVEMENKALLRQAVKQSARMECQKLYRRKFQERGRLNEEKFKTWFYSEEDKDRKIDIYYDRACDIMRVTRDYAERRLNAGMHEFLLPQEMEETV